MNTATEKNFSGQKNEAWASEVAALKSRIKRCEDLLYKNKILLKEDYGVYRNRAQQLVWNRACFPQEWESFRTSDGLKRKFDERGQYRPFYGDTTVFPIPQKWQSPLAILQQELYACAGFMLSEVLPPQTFHITLHDLSAGENQALVEDDMARHRAEMPALMKSVRSDEQICLGSVGIVSMVGSSLVMLFEPLSETDHIRLQEMYTPIDELSPLPYPMTLHCTLAYYRPGEYQPWQWNALLRKVFELNTRNPIEPVLDCDTLEYQRFTSMKDYVRVD